MSSLVSDAGVIRKKVSPRKLFFRIALYLTVIIIMILTLAPVAWLFISSIQTHTDVITYPIQWIPRRPTFENYLAMFDPSSSTGKLFLRAFKNSMIVSSTVTIICVFFGTLAAYALARLQFGHKKVLIVGMLSTRMLPTIALDQFFRSLGLPYRLDFLYPFNTLYNLVMLYTSFILGFVMWIMTGYFRSIPGELEEAARIDGCMRLQALFKVIVPLSSPGLVATIILTFLLAWDEFILALIFQRWILKGLTAGALKG